jgi:hypothetical protein
MACYEFYMIHSLGHVVSHENHELDGHIAALLKAQSLSDEFSVSMWSGRTQIAFINPDKRLLNSKAESARARLIALGFQPTLTRRHD